ncbi:thiamine pyrophosphate-binding protein [Salinigranum rubrum]|nr:thiamine pyrophosphate-binding protein [Salinigranum rubrum]
MKGYDAVLRLLASGDVGTIFTLLSEDTMQLVSTLDHEWGDDIGMIDVRHEQGALAMADGYARATGRIGVCLVGRGPAIAQTGTASVTARKNGSNVLVIVPETPLKDDYDVKEFEQESYLRSTIGNVISIRSHETLCSDFREALRRVKAGNGPIAVQISWDLLDSEMDVSEDKFFDRTSELTSGPSRGRVRPDADRIEQAIKLYVDSNAHQPPLIIAGRGAIEADAKGVIEEFAERTSALLATTLQARGYFSDHPYYLGFTGSWGRTIANKYATESNIVFAVGASLNPYTTDKGRLFDEDATVIQIDEDPSSIGRYTDISLGIHGDALLTIDALIEELRRLDIDRAGELWSDDLRAELETAPAMSDRIFPEVPGTIDPRDLVRTMDELLPTDRTVVCGSGHYTRWVLDGIHADPDDFTYAGDFAAIGLGLPMAIGAAAAMNNKMCIAICGDAGLMMSIQELETAVRNEIPLMIVVLNDSSLGAEYHSLDSVIGDGEVALVEAPDFADVANSFGAEGFTVRSIDELDALADRISNRPTGPMVVDCKVNHEVRHRSKL